MKLLVFLVGLKIVEGTIRLHIDIDKSGQINVNSDGYEKNIITQKYIDAFELTDENMRSAVQVFDIESNQIKLYLKKPKFLNDLFKLCKRLSDDMYDKCMSKYNDLQIKEEDLSTVIKVKSTKIKTNTNQTNIGLAEKTFRNFSKTKSLKVNAMLTQSVENSVTMTWANSTEWEFAKGVEIELNIAFFRAMGKVDLKDGNTWTVTGEESQKINVGSSSGMEVELKPGQAARAVLSVSKQTVVVDIEYEVTLTGNVFAISDNGAGSHSIYHFQINSCSKELTLHQTIKTGLFFDESVNFYDMETGLLL